MFENVGRGFHRCLTRRTAICHLFVDNHEQRLALNRGTRSVRRRDDDCAQRPATPLRDVTCSNDTRAACSM